MPGLILSTVAFFVAGYFVKRYLDEQDIPKGLTRSTLVFAIALAIAYGVAVAVNWVVA